MPKHAERPAGHVRHHPGPPASTEPRAEARGEARARGSFPDAHSLQRSRVPKHAESRPRLGRPAAYARLQRSRVPKHAERLAAPFITERANALQRSRVPKHAERSPPRRPIRTRRPASTEPRAEARGEAVTNEEGEPDTKLQRSRVPKHAERFQKMRGDLAPKSASTEPRAEARGELGGDEVEIPAGQLQRSRVPKHAESSSRSCRSNSGTSFNGAACRSTRRGRFLIIAPLGVRQASTEPRAEARGEPGDNRGTIDFMNWLQRSRVPKHAERRRRVTFVRSATRFNGAACRSTRRASARSETPTRSKPLQRSRVPKHAERSGSVRRPSSFTQLQRSRVPKHAESILVPTMVPRALWASTEPRAEARGEIAVVNGISLGFGASTEPRAEARGEISCRIPAVGRGLASTEPRAEARGEAAPSSKPVAVSGCFNGAACRSTRRGLP